MSVDEQNEEAPEASEAPAAPEAPAARTRTRRWILPAAVLLVVGLGLGVLGGVLLFGDASSNDATNGAAVECDEAQAVVDQSIGAIDEINQSETQDVSFFAAILVEQRAITFAMDAAPGCFSLDDRAGAVGLLEGIQALLAATANLPASAQSPVVEEPTVLEPTDVATSDPVTTAAP